MGLLGSGVLLWSLAHLMKRVAPVLRSRLGSAGRPLVAASIVLSVVLMILGYQSAEGPVWWARQSALVGINNLLVARVGVRSASTGTWYTVPGTCNTRVQVLKPHDYLSVCVNIVQVCTCMLYVVVRVTCINTLLE